MIFISNIFYTNAAHTFWIAETSKTQQKIKPAHDFVTMAASQRCLTQCYVDLFS